MNILALIIRIIHIMLVLFIVLAPFSKIAPLLILNITGGWCLLVHWAANNDVCFLTMMEGKLRNIDYRQGFLHQFVAPIYNISDKQTSQISYGVVILSMLISLYNLLKSEALKEAKKCYENSGSFLDCFKILFTI